MKQRTQAGWFGARGPAILACVLLLALGFSASLAWRFRDLPQLGQFHDDTLYLSAARSLAAGTGYRIASYPGAPYQTKYPPLYPLTLAPFAGTQDALVAVLWLTFAAFVLMSWLLFRRLGLDARGCLLLAILVALNPFLNFFAITPMTELLLGSMVIGVFLLVERDWIAAAGLLAGAAVLTRMTALPLLAAVPLWLLLRRRRRAAATFAALMLPCAAGWTWWSAAHRTVSSDLTTLYYTDYADYYTANFAWRDLPQMLWLNLDTMLLGIGRLALFDLNDRGIPKILVQVIGVACLAGIARTVRRNRWNVYTLFAAFSASMLLLWNFKPNERFLAGFTPLVLLGAYEELCHILGMLRGERRRLIAGLMSAAVAALLVFGAFRYLWGTTVHFPAALEALRENSAARSRAFEWIAKHTPPTGTVLTAYDGLLYLRTGRAGLRMFPRTDWFYRGEDERIRAFFMDAGGFAREHGLDHILLTPHDFAPYLQDADYERVVAVLSADARWERVFRDGRVYVFRTRP